MLHNHRCFLIVDDPAHFQDERFRIIPEHGKLERRHTLQNCSNAGARESGFFDQLPDEVIPHTAKRRGFGRLLVCFCLAEALAVFQLLFGGQMVCLFAVFLSDHNLCNIQLFIQFPNGILNQLLRIKGYCIDGFMVDSVPERKKFLLFQLLRHRDP